jgi:hypothetical protein
MPSIAIDNENIDLNHLLMALRNPDGFTPTKQDAKWLPFIKKLPPDLRSIITEEIASGNEISSIQASNWPTNESVFICMTKRFKCDYSNQYPETKYKLINDPHYWIEEIWQTINGVEHILIR